MIVRGSSHRMMLSFAVVAVGLLAGCENMQMGNWGGPHIAAADKPKVEALRNNVKHVIVIFQENWSFDGLYGKFPGANGIANAGAAAKQLQKDGTPYTTLPLVLNSKLTTSDKIDTRVPAGLPAGPLDLGAYIPYDQKTGDAKHRFYDHQWQINGGKNNMFLAYTDAGGLTMTYYDATYMPEGKLAQEFTLCDNFFQGAFGGSFLNHFWLIAAATPEFKNAKQSLRAPRENGEKSDAFTNGSVTWDGYAVNTIYSKFKPVKAGVPEDELLPPQQMPTIGDRLSEKNISWAWYGGGWNDALAGHASATYPYHHHPFQYFEKYGDGTKAKEEHLKDEKDFLAALETPDGLPKVCYVKPNGGDDAHPGDAALLPSQQHVADLVAAIRKSPYWKDSIIIVTYDENGGRWDHVAPPKGDRWGPGSRIPAIVIGPFAKKNYVDHTQHDTTSILKLIELRWDLKPLTTRDAAADGLLSTLEF